MNKVLVTGGAGFIGSHTVEALLERGVPVRVLDNLSSGFRANLPDRHALLEFVEGDITDAAAVGESFDGVSHCVHLAAQVSVVASLEDPLNSAMHNIIGYLNVLDGARRAGVERLVYASSAAVYGEPSEIPLPETAAKRQLSPYGLEKQVNEEYADLYRRLWGLPTLGLRFFNVYGPRQDPQSPYAGVIALFVDRISSGAGLTVFGDGKQTRDFVYVADVATAVIAALECDNSGACNIGTGRQSTLLDLIDTLAQLTGNRCEVEFAAARDGDIRHSLAVVDKMNRELGVRAAIPLKEGLRHLLDAVRASA